MEITRTWKYKDGSCYWWEIKLWKSGEQQSVDFLGACGEVSDEMDFQWEYEITRDDEHIYLGWFVGQYDVIPNLNDVLLNFQGYINSVVIGFAMFSKAGEEE